MKFTIWVLICDGMDIGLIVNLCKFFKKKKRSSKKDCSFHNFEEVPISIDNLE